MIERAIFEAALGIEDTARRALFLDQACAGNAALREQIDARLASHEHARPSSNASAAEPVPPSPTDTIAPTIQLPAFDEPPLRDGDSDQTSTPDLSFLEPTNKAGSIGVLGHYEVAVYFPTVC